MTTASRPAGCMQTIIDTLDIIPANIDLRAPRSSWFLAWRANRY